nr:tributyltin chloride resistant protein - Alteromonas sp. (strain M-1) [Alteromonas sp.]
MYNNALHGIYLTQITWMKSARAEPYLYYIVTEVEKRNLPIELALMPLIESDFNASAYSHKHASGLWQLTPAIAKYFKVQISPWYDGRQDRNRQYPGCVEFYGIFTQTL